MGTIVDATGGTVELTSAVSTAGGRQSGRFRGGAFRLTQATARSQVRRGRRVGFTVLSLADGAAPAPACPAATAVAAAKHGPPRRLWGDAHGNYRTVGRYAAATVGGTRWRTEDTCSGTLVTVARGVVAVENLRTHRTQVVRAGGSLLTKAPAPARANASPAFFVDFLHAVDRTTRLVRRPASIVLFADGKWGLIHLSWTGWGAAVAHATGTSISYGAPGDPPVETPGEVTLSNPGSFQGRLVYRCILVTVPPPADFGGRRCIRHVGRFYVFG